MYSTAVLLNKISPTRDGRTMTLADLQHLSFSELRKTFDDQLSWGESHYLYREAVEQKNVIVCWKPVFSPAPTRNYPAPSVGVLNETALHAVTMRCSAPALLPL
ncbi:hypothetical protein [Xenorhabdus bovienii]|uniref:Uncharacterized protein n=1 Tax=Xenorhabdus bovienii str. kraussei Becker Underwood TaxID=1398204 RepID=A0A077Q0A9_XENBV|nr:hypothetical protein [Xenorhabdus bovienii]CDH26442.1 hypothetical protein XBKB1_700007 [Xenorhabdus bovienii str. kraussei Becker Underwood]